MILPLVYNYLDDLWIFNNNLIIKIISKKYYSHITPQDVSYETSDETSLHLVINSTKLENCSNIQLKLPPRRTSGMFGGNQLPNR